jgi:glycosyltransferase involved in cell wall biosynthesis
MHILYIDQYFSTTRGIVVTRPYEFSRLWMAKGHNVTILTTTAKLTPEDLKNARGRFLKKLNIEGVKVLAFEIPYSQKMRYIFRCLSWAAFMFVSLAIALFAKNVNVIYARSTPLTVGIPAIAAKWLRKIPFVFEVTDQWPEIPIQMGIIKNKIIIKLLLWLEKTIYKYSDSIVACSPGMADGVREVIKKAKLREKPIAVIPNFAETHFYRPDIDGSKVRQEKGWDDKLVFLHAGTMGRVNSLDFVIDAAVRVRDNPAILFVLLGEGNQKPALLSGVRELGLSNVEISPAVPRYQLPEVLAAADVAIVIFGNYPILEHNSANKFFDALAAGKPVLLNYSGWQREILEDNKAGFGCEQCSLDEFVEKVLYFSTHRKQLPQMGRNARRVAEEKFDRDKLAAQALSLLEAVLNG